MLKKQVESLLFVSSRPVGIRSLASFLGRSKDEIEVVVASLEDEYNNGDRGVKIIKTDKSIQMVSIPENTELVAKYLKEDLESELTRPQLETLAIIAYRGPVAKYIIDQVRGVHSGLILRNLSIKGLVEVDEKDDTDNNIYRISTKLLQHLGFSGIDELPDYQKLSKDNIFDELLGAEDSNIRQD